MNTKNSCALCYLSSQNPKLYAEVVSIYNTGTGEEAARKADVGVYIIRKHFVGVKNRSTACVDAATARHNMKPVTIVGATPSMELTADGHGFINSGEIAGDAPVKWDELIRILGGDPDSVTIKNDTIRVSARTNADGVIVRSYGASLAPRNIAVTENDYLQSIKTIKANMNKPSGLPKPKRNGATFMIAWGDTQVGKAAGGGVEGVIHRFFDSIDKAIVEYHDNIKAGYTYKDIFMPIMGDITEGVAGNYDAQLFTVKLNACDQELLGFELICWAIERVRTETGLPLTIAFVNSNHGEKSRLSMRGGSKNVTSASDTNDRMFGELVKRFYSADKNVNVIVPGGNLVVPVKVNGVAVAIAHGHGIGPRAKANTIQQELLIYDAELTALNGGTPFMPRLWITAHYHHFQVADLGPYTWIQTPALDGGSEWFTNMSGRYSRPGLVTASIGEMFEGGIDRVRAIWVAETPAPRKPTAQERLIVEDSVDRSNSYSE
jgi:hypothetical protein